MELTVTCIIPAWNEAARLPGVLAAVVGHPWVDRVLVVDDGSTDGTTAVAQANGAQVLTLAANGGKSAAVAAGLRQVKSDIVLLVDADLQGFGEKHVTQLLKPLRDGVADASISLRSNAPWPWRLVGLDYISGERAMFTARLQPHLASVAKLRGFGLEVFLNHLWLCAGHRIAVVPLSGVASPSKGAKRGRAKGIVDDLIMICDIFRTVGIGRVIGQIVRLRMAGVR